MECEKPITSILHPDLKHSTSCRDVTSCFYHIKDLWNQMGWQSVQNNRSLLAASVDVSDLFLVNFQFLLDILFTYRLFAKMPRYMLQLF